MSKCRECGGKGVVTLLNRVVPCSSCTEPVIHDEYAPKSGGLSFVKETAFGRRPLSKPDFYKKLYGGKVDDAVDTIGRAPSELLLQDPIVNVREVFEAAASSRRIVEARAHIDLDVAPNQRNTRTTTITIVEEID